MMMLASRSPCRHSRPSLRRQVRAADGLALSRRFVAALDAWARARRLLLCEDSVLLGLRCGHWSASELYLSLIHI